MVRMNIEVDEAVRDKWNKHKEEHEKYQSRTHLIRTAVTNQIKFDKEFNGTFNQAVKDSSIQGDELDELKEDLNKTLKSFQNDINQLQVEIQGTDDNTLLSNLMSEFHDLLVRTSADDIESGEAEGTSVNEIINRARTEGSLSTDMNEIDARKALDQLANDLPSVKSYVDEDGKRHYYEKK